MEETLEILVDGKPAYVPMHVVLTALAKAGVRSSACRTDAGEVVSITVSVSPAPPAGVGSYETPPPDPRLFEPKGPNAPDKP